jgi:hypothetical protein
MSLLAFEISEAPLMIVKGLAVIAGALIGAFLLGLIVRLLVRLARPKPMPGWALSLVRLAGAGAGGVAAWLLVADLQGLGWGGGGLFGRGRGRDSGSEERRTDEVVRKDEKPPPKDTDKGSKQENKPLHVFVLGLQDLKDRLKTETPDIEKCYWIQDEPGTKVRDLKGLKKELNDRRDKKPNLKVYMDRTKYSPDRGNPDFSAPLERWLRDEKLYTSEK